MSKPLANLRKAAIRGFTIAEMIIAVTVLAVLAGMAAPPLVTFMQQRDKQQEELTLDEIRKAIIAYLAETATLPDSAAGDSTVATNWSVLLASKTNMSPSQMAKDPWGNPRLFISGYVDTTLLNSTVRIWYATVHSAGADRIAEGGNVVAPSTVSGIPVNTSTNPDSFDAVTSTSWWNKVGAGSTVDSALFSRLSAKGDDMLMKFTDYGDKLERYNQTLARLEKVGQALETYAKTAYGERVLACSSTTCSPTAEQQVFYPRAQTISPAPGDTDSLYASTNGNSDLDRYNGNNNGTFAVTEAIYNGTGSATNHHTRRTHMISLMRILGLPDDYCCSALETYTSGGVIYQMPFYYSSNPRPRASATTCGSRPGVSSRKLPARLVSTYQAEAGTSTPSCL